MNLTCGRCERGMRPHGTKASEYPGALKRGTGDLCQTCSRHPAGYVPVVRCITPKVRACALCLRPTRPYGARIADYPETLARAGKHCVSCDKSLHRTFLTNHDGPWVPLRRMGEWWLSDGRTVSEMSFDSLLEASMHADVWNEEEAAS